MSGRTRKKSRHNKGRKPLYKEHRRYLPSEADYVATAEPAPAFSLLPSETTIEEMSDSEVAEMFATLRWPEGVHCPRCQTFEPYRVQRNDRAWNWRCRNTECHYNFTLTSGTPFSSSKVPLRLILTFLSIVQSGAGDGKINRIAMERGLHYKVAYILIGKCQEFLGGKIEGVSVFVGYSSSSGYPRPAAPRKQIGIPEGRRRCSKCGVVQPTDKFALKCGTAGAWGLRVGVCRDCTAARSSKGIKAAWDERKAIDAATPIEVRSAAQLIAETRPGHQFWTRSNWTGQEKQDLSVLCDAGIPLATAGAVLSRSPSSLAWYARDMGLSLPADWRAVVTPKRLYVPRSPRIQLQYPFLPKGRPGDADLLRVNDLVPRAFPEHMRADICQSVMLSLLEGEITIADLEANRSNLTWFVKRWRREQTPYQEVQLGTSDDERSYEDIAASVKTDADRFARNEAQSALDAQDRRSTEPTQIDDVYGSEVGVARYVGSDEHLTRYEAAQRLDSGEIMARDLPHKFFAPHDGMTLHARQRLTERWGIDPTADRARAILSFCRGRKPEFISAASGDEGHTYMSRAHGPITFIYHRRDHQILTVFEPVSAGDRR